MAETSERAHEGYEDHDEHEGHESCDCGCDHHEGEAHDGCHGQGDGRDQVAMFVVGPIETKC